MRFHTNLGALAYPVVWAAIAGALTNVAASVQGHFQIWLLSLSGICTVVAVVLKSPDTVELEKQKCDNQEVKNAYVNNG